MKKEQMDREEKKNMKKRKGKGKGRGKKFVGTAVLLIVALFVLGFLIGKFGFGFGGQGDGEGESASQTQTSSELSTNSKNMIAVSVVENDYLFENKKITLDELMTKLKAMDNICVEITSDNAALKTYNSLTDKLKAEGIEYVEKK
ncbi:MAG: hypothetical protein IJB96_02665 [Lachnospira sp.]|nr:hypothetical protein [Lachnospira sp.]